MAIRCTRDNPFRDCADPGSAIPSAACDRALAALEHAIVSQRSPIVLLGPVGGGKTLLLRRIVEQPPLSTRTIFVPWLNVPAEEVIPWIHAFEGSEAPEENFAANARALHTRGVRTLLLVDEVQSMPRESAERLAELVREAGSSLQVVLAGMESHALESTVGAFRGNAEYVKLEGEVTPPEVASWLHDRFDIDHLSPLRELDCVELVRKVKGVPRLVRWELERRFAKGDLPEKVGQEWVEGIGEERGTTPTAESRTVDPSPQATPTDRLSPESRLPVAHDGEEPPGVRFISTLRRGALWSEEACRKTVRVGRRYALSLGRMLGEVASEIGDAAISGMRTMTILLSDRGTGVSARGRGALHNARRSLALRARRAGHVFLEAVRRCVDVLERIALHARRLSKRGGLAAVDLIARAVPAMRDIAGRAAQRALELVRVNRPIPSPKISEPKRADVLWRIPEIRTGPLAVFAIVATGAFLLGRVTALSNAGRSSSRPAIVSSGPPPPESGVGLDRTIASQPSAGTGTAQGTSPEANPAEPSPAPPPPQRKHTVAPPMRVFVKIEAHPQARIWVDGHDVGRTPLARVPLAPGRHNFQVLFADGRKMHRTLDIRYGTHVVKFS